MEVELFLLERRMITLKDSIAWYKKQHKYREYFRYKREYRRCNKRYIKLKKYENSNRKESNK